MEEGNLDCGWDVLSDNSTLEEDADVSLCTGRAESRFGEGSTVRSGSGRKSWWKMGGKERQGYRAYLGLCCGPKG